MLFRYLLKEEGEQEEAKLTPPSEEEKGGLWQWVGFSGFLHCVIVATFLLVPHTPFSAEKGQVYLNDNRIKLAELKLKLQAIRQVQKGKEVFLRADKSVPYGVVMKAIATIKEAGIVKLGMITQPPPTRS